MRKIKYKVTTDKKIIKKVIHENYAEPYITSDITKICIIATHEDKICGCALGREQKNNKSGEIHLAWMASYSGFQERKEAVGTNLLTSFCQEAKRLGYNSISLNSLSEAMPFYKNLKVKKTSGRKNHFRDSIEDFLRRRKKQSTTLSPV
ncbi:MAG: GNAT family N-acetyltransferase [Alphaproteobacteria bacterium]|nr:GNAT family N-acetyltransferase [Alphaproteobacteria bacterium]MCV6598882.1 GNAT family N-acetyltransferase [Alphaproteobacteria bacterium]